MKLAPKLILIITSLTLVAIAFSAVVVFTTTRSTLQRQISTSQLETTGQTMDKIDRFLFERLIDIRGLAERDAFHVSLVSNTSASAQASANTLNAFHNIAAVWSELSVLDTKGQVRTATESSDLGDNFLKEDPTLGELYHQVLQTGVPGSTDVFNNVKDHTPTAVFMAPIKNGQAIVGVVAGEVDWSSIQNILATVKGPAATLLNSHGQLIAGNETKLTDVLSTNYGNSSTFKGISQAANGSAILDGLAKDQEQSVTSHIKEPGFMDYRGHDWYLVVSTPSSIAFAPAQQLAISLVVILVISILVIIALILYLLNSQVIRPISSLSAAVSRISLGDLSQTVPVHSKDEIGLLSNNFNEMTRQLAATHRNLEAASQAAIEGRAQLESSINGLRQGFILTNAKGEVVMANIAARGLVREANPTDAPVAPHTVESLSLDQIAGLLPSDLGLKAQIRYTLDRHEQAKFPNIPLGGRFLNLYLSPVINGSNAIGCVLLLEDVTEERIMQRSRDEFFSIASHELRTPLTAIRGNTSLIKQYFPETLKDPSMNEMVNDIHDSAVRLIEIVNDFLDASRLEQNKMKFTLEAFPIERVIEKVIYEMAGVSRDKEIYLNFDQHTLGKIPMIYADSNRVKQVIYNLIGNAMKFTEHGGVTINCLHEGDKLKVTVTDTGPGISPEGQQILFHKFQQTSSSLLTRDNTRGTGLGLYISKLLVEHMGGAVKLEHSEVGKGTTFSFTVPTASAEQVKAAEAKAAEIAKAQAAANGAPTPVIADVPAVPDTKPLAPDTATTQPKTTPVNVSVKTKTPRKKPTTRNKKDV